jgi:hypothetical protein
MPTNRKSFILTVAIFCSLSTLSGCSLFRNHSITAPAPPAINPSDYSTVEYTGDVGAYKAASLGGTAPNSELAKQKRNDIVYGLMTDIDVVYGDYYNRLFSSKNAVAIGGDVVSFGLSTAATIATHGATKTILSALGGGFSGVGLSIDKNYFAQQTFPVIGVAMQTRRDKVRAKIIENLAVDTATYPLLAAKRDLIAYLNAGTLASGLQELQEEAGAATASGAANAAVTKPTAPSSLNAVAGSAQVSLLWAPSSTATTYNLYYSITMGVTPTSGTKISGIAANSYMHPGLTNGTPYFYVVTAVNSAGESDPSPQATATPAVPIPAGGGAPSAPVSLHAVGGNLQVSLLWAPSTGATSYDLYYSTTVAVTPASGTKISGIATNAYTHTGLTNGTTYFYIVTAVNASGESGPSSPPASATPTTLAHLQQMLKMTDH